MASAGTCCKAQCRDSRTPFSSSELILVYSRQIDQALPNPCAPALLSLGARLSNKGQFHSSKNAMLSQMVQWELLDKIQLSHTLNTDLCRLDSLAQNVWLLFADLDSFNILFPCGWFAMQFSVQLSPSFFRSIFYCFLAVISIAGGILYCSFLSHKYCNCYSWSCVCALPQNAFSVGESKGR